MADDLFSGLAQGLTQGFKLGQMMSDRRMKQMEFQQGQRAYDVAGRAMFAPHALDNYNPGGQPPAPPQGYNPQQGAPPPPGGGGQALQPPMPGQPSQPMQQPGRFTPPVPSAGGPQPSPGSDGINTYAPPRPGAPSPAGMNFDQSRMGPPGSQNRMGGAGNVMPTGPGGPMPQARGPMAQPIGGGNVSSLDQAAAQRYGINPSDLARERQIESRGNPNAHNASGADGSFQFMPSTARQYGVNTRDPVSSTYGAAHLMADNKAYLSRTLGRDPSGAELYLAHQQGMKGAAALLSNPNAPAAMVVGQKAVTANGGRPGMTSSEFVQMWTDKFNKTPQAPVASALASPQGQQQISGTNGLKYVVDLINQHNPDASPGDKMRALGLAYPYFDKENQLAFKEQAAQLKTQVADLTAAHHAVQDALGEEKADETKRSHLANEQLKVEHEQRLGAQFDAKHAADIERVNKQSELATEKLRQATTQKQIDNARKEREEARRNKEDLEKRRHNAVQEAISASNSLGLDADKQKEIEDDSFGRAGRAEKEFDAAEQGAQERAAKAPRNEDSEVSRQSAAPASSGMPTVSSEEDYAKLKKGDKYVGPDGKTYTKNQ